MSTADTGSPFAGSRVLADGRELSSALSNGDWLDGGIAFFQGLGDAAQALSDPIGTITSCGLGWVMGHLAPLSTWLNQLAGSADQVQTATGRWNDVGTSMRTAGGALNTRLGDLHGMSGATVSAYLAFGRDAATHLSASGDWADSVATGLGTASQLVSKMQGVVKNAISQVVSTAIEAMAVVAASFGLGMGYAIARVVTKVNEMVNKVVKPVLTVLRSIKALTTLVSSVHRLFDQVTSLVNGVADSHPATADLATGAVADVTAATAFGRTGILNLASGALVETAYRPDALLTDAEANLQLRGRADRADRGHGGFDALTTAGVTGGAAAVGVAGVAALRSAGLMGRPVGATTTGTTAGTGTGARRDEKKRSRHRLGATTAPRVVIVPADETPADETPAPAPAES